MNRLSLVGSLLAVSLSACVPVTTQAPEATIPATSTPTTPSKPEPTPTPPATPTPVPTLPPPIELAYTISIIDPADRTVHVRLDVTELHRPLPVLTFWTNAGEWFGDWLDPWTNITNLRGADNAGESLSTSIVDDGIPWTGDGLWIDTEGAAGVVVEYDTLFGVVDQNFSGDRQQLMAGYMNAEFAVAEPEFFLLAPVDVETADYVMTLRFDLPEEQVSVSHWERLSEHVYSIDAADKAFAYGAVAFGQISSREQTINQTNVRVAAYGIDSGTFEQVADNTFQLYEYYETAFGVNPVPAFVLVYVPDVTDGLYLAPYNEQSGGFFNRYLPWYDAYWSDHIAHPIAHNWIGGGMHGEQWFQEGFVNYYELKSCEVIGVYSRAFVQGELAERFTQYTTRIVGTQNDFSLVEAANRYNQDHGFPHDFLVYEKGSLLAYVLDLRIAQASGGERSLDDVVAVLWSRYGPGTHQENIGVPEVQWATEEVMGQDLAPFFNAYVRGTEPLPLAIRQGEVVMTDGIAP